MGWGEGASRLVGEAPLARLDAGRDALPRGERALLAGVENREGRREIR